MGSTTAAAPPHPKATSDQPAAGPAIAYSIVAQEFTAALRECVSSRSVRPAGASSDDKIAIALRVSFDPNGKLATAPANDGANFSSPVPANAATQNWILASAEISGIWSKHLFHCVGHPGDFLRLKPHRSIKTLLFLFVALTIPLPVARSIIRSCLAGSRVLMEQLAPRNNAKAP